MAVAGLQVGYESYATEERILGAHGISFRHCTHPEDVAGKDRIRALMVRQIPITPDVMDMFPALEVIQRYGVGVDNVDLDAATARGVKVCNTPDYGQEHEVSDHALALYLALSRRLVRRDSDVRRGVWGVDQAEPITGHRGATLGLIGFGRIAQAAWQKFRALGFARCVVSDPLLTQEVARRHGVEITDVPTLCECADVVSLHCPLLPATYHVIDEGALSQMKPTAFLINVSRGGLVDEVALTDALETGGIAGAGLDVFETEPANTYSPVFCAPNTVLTDHVAWYSEASVLALQTAAAEEVVRVLVESAPQNAIN